MIQTPGCEINVKEIYDKTQELTPHDPERSASSTSSR